MNQPQTMAPADIEAIGEFPERGFTLPSRYYLDPDIFEREKDRIFYRNWHYVCHAPQVEHPGDYLTTRIADENVFVIRGEDGELRGFYNVCRHRAHQLLQGSGNTGNIVCPYHAWSYSSAGELRYARNAENVTGFDMSEFCLPRVQVEVFLGFVFVNLDLEAEPLASKAADLEEDIRERVPDLDSMTVKVKAEFGGLEMNAGWKVVVDNYVECYHCTLAHVDFASLIDMNAYQTETFGCWSRQLGPDTRQDNSAYAFGGNQKVQSAAFWYLWPNITFNMVPGSPNLSVINILPLDAETTSFVGDQLGTDDFDLDDARMEYLTTILGPEDQALCESVQRGLRSRGYEQGRFVVDPEKSGIAEHAVHHFHRMVLEALDHA